MGTMQRRRAIVLSLVIHISFMVGSRDIYKMGMGFKAPIDMLCNLNTYFTGLKNGKDSRIRLGF